MLSFDTQSIKESCRIALVDKGLYTEVKRSAGIWVDEGVNMAALYQINPSVGARVGAQSAVRTSLSLFSMRATVFPKSSLMRTAA